MLPELNSYLFPASAASNKFYQQQLICILHCGACVAVSAALQLRLSMVPCNSCVIEDGRTRNDILADNSGSRIPAKLLPSNMDIQCNNPWGRLGDAVCFISLFNTPGMTHIFFCGRGP